MYTVGVARRVSAVQEFFAPLFFDVPFMGMNEWKKQVVAECKKSAPLRSLTRVSKGRLLRKEFISFVRDNARSGQRPVSRFIVGCSFPDISNRRRTPPTSLVGPHVVLLCFVLGGLRITEDW